MAKEKILIIDDDKNIRNASAEFLRSEGFEVSTADCGEKGIEILESSAFEIIISDLKMPGIDGIEVLKHVKKNYPKTDIIIVTAHGTIENAVEAMRLGAYDYITKNFDLSELKLLLDRCLEKQRLSAEVRELKELVNLYEVSKAMSSLMGIDELLNLILMLVCDTLSAEGGSIMLYESETHELVVKVASGSRKDNVIGQRIALGGRVAGYAAKNEQMISIHGNIKDDPRFSNLVSFDNIKSSITAPLQRKGRLLGVICLNRREDDIQFNERDRRLLSIFAVEAAIAIENTNLFNNLEKEKEELDIIFTNMADGSIATDTSFNIIRMNRSAEELLGFQQKESLSKNYYDVIKDFEPSISWDEIKNQPEQIIRYELVRRDGKSLYLSVLATKIFDNENNLRGHIMMMRNITDQKREGKIKMDFLSIMTHKLKTPLTTINGFSTLLMEKIKDKDEKMAFALQAIRSQGNLLNELVDSLLRFTLLESEYTKYTMERCSIMNILDICKRGISGFLATNPTEVSIDPEMEKMPYVHVDSMKIVEVIQNLIENAIKFNNKKNKTVKITGHRGEGQFIVIRISDNGPGIPPEEFKKIFQKFYQIDEDQTGQVRGVGLGLALVKQIVESHGGKIWVESKIGEGSTFNLTLPIEHKS
ncbi:MAG: response regulator [Endomicrobiales bacterium]|nr:response regulator [Endomicrobiales bacterium]